MYIDKLDDIVKKYNNTISYHYYTSIKMKPVDVKDNEFRIEKVIKIKGGKL